MTIEESVAINKTLLNEAYEIAKKVYRKAFNKQEALCAPYAAVIDIDTGKLPAPDTD